MEKLIEVKISDIGTVVGGATPSTKDEANYNGDIVWITPKDLSGYNQRYIGKGERNISRKGYNSCSTTMLPKNSILFSSRAPIGYVAISERDLCTNQGFKSIIPNDSINYMYLFYMMKYRARDIENIASGTTFKEISGSVMKNVILKIHNNKEEQTKIANILSSIDSKIENNNRINDNLYEQMINTFKNDFVDNCDETWPLRKIGDYLNLERGLSYKGKYLSDSEGIPMINLGNILPNSKFRNEKLKFYTGDFKEKHCVHPGDLVVANTDLTQNREVLGSVIIVPQLDYDNIICTHHISIIRNCKLPKTFIFNLLNMKEFRVRVAGFATGTTVLALPNEALLNCDFYLPGEDKIEGFNQYASSILEKIEINRLENQKLVELRDTLLPKLMSGEIDVSNIKLDI